RFEDLSESNEEFSSTDDDSLSFDKIDYVEASPPDSELVSSEVMEIVIPEVGGIKASNDNPIPSYDPIIPGNPPNLTPYGESEFFSEEDYTSAITTDEPVLSTEEPDNSLSMGDEHLDTIPVTKSDEFIKSSVENLIPIPSESEGIPDHRYVLEKIVSKPLSEEEIIPMKSLRTHDSSLLISSKIDSLLDEFAGELTLLKSIPPGIDETDCDFEEDIRLIEKLFVAQGGFCLFSLKDFPFVLVIDLHFFPLDVVEDALAQGVDGLGLMKNEDHQVLGNEQKLKEDASDCTRVDDDDVEFSPKGANIEPNKAGSREVADLDLGQLPTSAFVVLVSSIIPISNLSNKTFSYTGIWCARDLLVAPSS
nr:hypothetical protein [Tanacetum cinerariifolium]